MNRLLQLQDQINKPLVMLSYAVPNPTYGKIGLPLSTLSEFDAAEKQYKSKLCFEHIVSLSCLKLAMLEFAQ